MDKPNTNKRFRRNISFFFIQEMYHLVRFTKIYCFSVDRYETLKNIVLY